MARKALLATVWGALALAWAQAAAAQQPPSGTWRFLAAGDSRNCGDVVMPAIAKTAKRNNVAFYWHLGDLRAIANFDEDIQHQPEHRARPLSLVEYLNAAWPDFIENQVGPFGAIPFFIAIGNHETVAPMKTREDFLLQFSDWLNTPLLRVQRLRDDPRDHRLKSYFHWKNRGVAFYSLDNATLDQFDPAQMRWFERVLARDSADPAVTTIVVGMHRPLPDSISASHGMNESAVGIESGRRVYASLLRAQNQARKRVYVLSSHSHYFMEGIFNTETWKQNGGVLPGWIVGTAGAVRYALPPGSPEARQAMTNVYGSLMGTVLPGGEIRFAFQKLAAADVPAEVTSRYGEEFVRWCFQENTQVPRQ